MYAPESFVTVYCGQERNFVDISLLKSQPEIAINAVI